MSSKKSKSFADALLSADVSESQPSISKPKPKKSKVFNVNEKFKATGTKGKINSKKRKGSTDCEKYTFHSLLGIEREIANLEKCVSSDDEPIVPETANKTFDRSKYGSCTSTTNTKDASQSQPSSKLIKKLLKENEESKKHSLMLKEVNEDQLLFNLQLDSGEEIEDFNIPDVKIPVLPEGISNIHSLACHTLYVLDKVQWPFLALMNKKDKLGGITGKASVTYLASLTKDEIRQHIVERTLMDQEIEIAVLNPLLLYLVRYIAAYPHKERSQKVTSNDDEVLVESAYQLVCYHVSITSSPVTVLLQCLSEVPLALVNIGCAVTCFPAVVLEKWKVGELKHLSEKQNTPYQNIEQMKTMYRLLTILCNCLSRTAEYLKKNENQRSKIKTADIDNLLSWLVLFSQDSKVINSSLQTIVGDTICHALELYENFMSKIQDLVEVLSNPWRDYGEESLDIDASSSPNQNLKSFPHHTACYVCCNILSATPKARKLSSSLAFLSLCMTLECEDLDVLDYVKMIDVINVLESRRVYILQSCELYQLKSVLLLLDNCITEILSRDQVEHNMSHYKAVDEFLRVECARVLGGGETSVNVISSTRLKTQLTGIKSALLEKWEKLWLVGEAVYNPSGVRISVRGGDDPY